MLRTGQIQPPQGFRLGGRRRGSRQADVIEPDAGGAGRLLRLAPPVALALKGVARQALTARAEGPVEAGPVDRLAAAMKLREAGEDHLQVGTAGGQRRQQPQRRGLRHLAGHADQRGPRTDLQQGGHPLLHQHLHPLGKAHRADHVVAPVVRRGDLGTGQLTGEVAHHDPARQAETELPQLPLECGQHRLHGRGVESVRHRQGMAGQAGLLRQQHQGLKIGARA